MTKPFTAADILLPAAGTDLSRFAALACDQFTSEPAYWAEAERIAEGVPSTLHLTLPEAYLDAPDVGARMDTIHDTMRRYLDTVLTRRLHGFVYVERTTDSGTRQGLVGAVDLDAYSYDSAAPALVRPSERTVPERIPPRLAVRRGAALETPHIMMLLDDARKTIVEPLAERYAGRECLYDIPLMLGGGTVRGWAVTDADEVAALENAIAALGTPGAFAEKYPAAAGRAPFALAVGDGNHSLACAKAYWEELKPTILEPARANHPARYCLAEVVNLHSGALTFAPIHRAVFGVPLPALLADFTHFLAARGASVTADGAGQVFTFFDGAHTERRAVQNAPCALAVETMENWLTAFLAETPAARVDYIHDEESLRGIVRAQPGAVGIVMPPIDKDNLLLGVAQGGVLPKKAFSMGNAREKRYYLECRGL